MIEIIEAVKLMVGYRSAITFVAEVAGIIGRFTDTISGTPQDNLLIYQRRADHYSLGLIGSTPSFAAVSAR